MEAQLRGAEQFQCDTCCRKTDAERGVQLVRMPTILSLQLKRFGFDFKTHQRHKVNTPVAFETELDMARFLHHVPDKQPQAEAADGAAGGAEGGDAAGGSDAARLLSACSAVS